MSQRVQPPVTEVSAPFWEATRERRLVVQHCAQCDLWVWYPRSGCTRCLQETLAWREVSGRGTVYAVSVHHRPGVAEMKERVPYAVALIELHEGVRMLSNVVGIEPAAVRIDQPVTVTWEALEDGRHLPLFEPAGPR